MKRRGRDPCGFTLIELLVVIAIIAVLAAILFPVFAKARLRSANAVCLSNLRQLGIVLQGYAEDYDDHLPVGVDTFWGDQLHVPTPSTPWLHTVLADRTLPSLWHCPADRGFRWWNTEFTTADVSYTPSCFAARGQSYDYNLLMVWDPLLKHIAPIPVSRVKSPSSIVLMKDAHFAWHTANSPRNPLQRDLNTPPAWNCLYIDGHARYVRPAWFNTYTVDAANWWLVQNNPR